MYIIKKRNQEVISKYNYTMYCYYFRFSLIVYMYVIYYKNLKRKNVYIQTDKMLQVDKNYYKLFSLKLLQILL